jgi:hypothetical protein
VLRCRTSRPISFHVCAAMELRLRELGSNMAMATSCKSSSHELTIAASRGVVELCDLLRREGGHAGCERRARGAEHVPAAASRWVCAEREAAPVAVASSWPREQENEHGHLLLLQRRPWPRHSLSASAGLPPQRPLSAPCQRHNAGEQSLERVGEKRCRGRDLPHVTQTRPAKHRSPGRASQVFGSPPPQHTTARPWCSMKCLEKDGW